MYDRFTGSGGRNDAVAIPRVWAALALSILVHAATLIVVLPRLSGPAPREDAGETGERLEVELASQRAAAPALTAAPTSSAPAHEARTIVQAAGRVHSAPPRAAMPVLAVPTPQTPMLSPSAPAPGVAALPPSPAAIASAQAAPSVGGDLSSFIAAQRRAREEQSMPDGSDNARRERIVASNAPGEQGPTDDEQRRRGGGIFEITRMNFDDAEFLFFGWNGDARRGKTQAYEVRLGDNGDMRIAVVRRMIAIIREHEQGSFRWRSWRLGRIVVLSARPEDNAGLEDFMLQEFFEHGSEASSR